MFVFALNTIVGFACSSIGVFHRSHHHDNSAQAVEHHGKHRHNHPQEHKENHKHSDKDEKQKDDCCSNSVVSLQKADKSPSRSIEAPNVTFATVFVLAYFSLPAQLIQENTFFPEHVRWRLPTTIQDLRIVIQSFQI